MNATQKLIKPELLMPAGTLQKLKLAYKYGADAVYCGVPLFSLRARENEFNLANLKEGIAIARRLGRKIYFTVNVFARNTKIKPFSEILDELVGLGPDALIMGDPGLIAMVRERHPQQEIHLSVQANCMNWQAVKFWKSQGLTRIILSRELKLTEIQEIHRQVPDIELEAFVHGSVCIAYSGRCLLSQYMSYRDANQGVCDNSCRYPYKVFERPEQSEFFVEDQRTPGELYPIDEDENGTYIMNSKDLCLIENLAEIVNTGVISLKIEGRTKSDFYVALVTHCYRRAIDDLVAGRPFDPSLLRLLLGSANRGYTKGFMAGMTPVDTQNYQPEDRSLMSPYLAHITGQEESQIAKVNVTGAIKTGDEVRILTPDGIKTSLVTKLLSDKRHEVDILHPGRKDCFIGLERSVDADQFVLQT